MTKMTKLRIYYLAISELLNKIEFEEKSADGPIKRVRLFNLNNEYDELRKLIIEEEKNEVFNVSEKSSGGKLN